MLALSNKADFERLMATRSRKRSAHFSLHHVVGRPLIHAKRTAKVEGSELSTAVEATCPELVDDSLTALWFGCIVPKRHARRAVTRSLFKRQVRAAFGRHRDALAAGLWLVRLRAPFSVKEFVSACSSALSKAARTELDELFDASVVAPRVRRPAAAS